MKKYNFLIVGLLLLFLCSPVPASAENELVLHKEPLFERQSNFLGGHDPTGCDGLYKVRIGKDVSDMRDFQYFLCDGKYTLYMEGPSGNMVTVFGDFNFQTGGGYLIVRKRDDRLVWLLDLEAFPPGQWVTIPPTADSGSYDAYYQAAPRFEQNIASVRWGHWWGNLQ